MREAGGRKAGQGQGSAGQPCAEVLSPAPLCVRWGEVGGPGAEEAVRSSVCQGTSGHLVLPIRSPPPPRH
eukprot:3039275-Pyramimonas_sp.AAC.1